MSTDDEEKKTWLDEAFPPAQTSPRSDTAEPINDLAQESDEKKQQASVIPILRNVIPHSEMQALSGRNSGANSRGVASLTGPELTALQSEWRAGAMTVGQMCEMWRIDRKALLVAAERWGKRALRDEYRAGVAAGLVDEDAALGAVRAGDASPVDHAVARAVVVVQQHKREIKATRELLTALVEELRGMMIDPAELEAWAELAAEVRAGLRSRDGDAQPGNAKQHEQFRSVLATFMAILAIPSRATVIDKLTGALVKAVTIERTTFGIVDDGKPVDAVVPIEERLRAYTQNGGIVPPKPATGHAA